MAQSQEREQKLKEELERDDEIIKKTAEDNERAETELAELNQR